MVTLLAIYSGLKSQKVQFREVILKMYTVFLKILGVCLYNRATTYNMLYLLLIFFIFFVHCATMGIGMLRGSFLAYK